MEAPVNNLMDCPFEWPPTLYRYILRISYTTSALQYKYFIWESLTMRSLKPLIYSRKDSFWNHATSHLRIHRYILRISHTTSVLWYKYYIQERCTMRSLKPLIYSRKDSLWNHATSHMRLVYSQVLVHIPLGTINYSKDLFRNHETSQIFKGL